MQNKQTTPKQAVFKKKKKRYLHHCTALTLFQQPEGVLKRRVQRVLLCHKLRQVLLALHLVHGGGSDGSPE